MDGDTVELSPNGKWQYWSSSSAGEASVRIVKDESDPFENTRRVITESWMNFGDSDYGFMLGSGVRIDSIYCFNIGVTAEIGCLNEQTSVIKIQLENDEIVELSQISEDNCSAIPTATFIALSPEDRESKDFIEQQHKNLSALRRYDWISLRIEGSTNSVVFRPVSSKKFEGKDFFRAHLSALEEAY